MLGVQSCLLCGRGRICWFETQNFEKSVGNTVHPTLLPMTLLLVCVNVWMCECVNGYHSWSATCSMHHCTLWKPSPDFTKRANNSKTGWIIYIFVIQGAYTHTNTNAIILAGRDGVSGRSRKHLWVWEMYQVRHTNTFYVGVTLRLVSNSTAHLWCSFTGWKFWFSFFGQEFGLQFE